ncbi:MAG: DNA helicase RecG, partial [Cyanobacteria bacterium J083]
MKEKPDWIRLHKALAIEVEKGFANVQGNQYRFHEFLCLSFGQSPPAKITPEQRRHWHKIAEHFATYPELSLVQRRHLIADTRRFLRQLQASLEVAKSSSPPQPRLPQTKTITSQLSSNSCGLQLSLDKPLAQVPGIGTAKSKYLERLGLYYVRDLIYYYPRDYIDYARQVNIKNLVAGETVTIVGTVRRCNCFTSPKNKKLTIFELLIQDNTGQIRLNRFFAGNRYNNRGYQEKIKRQYPRGYVVAASGLVKKNKYGLT